MGRTAKLCWRTIPPGRPLALRLRACRCWWGQRAAPLTAGRHLLPSEVCVPLRGHLQPHSRRPPLEPLRKPHEEDRVEEERCKVLTRASLSLHPCAKKQVTTARPRDAVHSPQHRWAAVRLWPRASENAPLQPSCAYSSSSASWVF